MTSPLEPNDLSHLSDEEFMALCPQGFHGTGDFEPDHWRNKIMALVKKHDLGFLHNPGGGQFTNADKGINIQVPLCDYQQDYVILLKGLLELEMESFKSFTDPSSPMSPSSIDQDLAAACREWIKGCTCADRDAPWQCKECTDAFLLAVLDRSRRHGLKIGEYSLDAAPSPKLPMDDELVNLARELRKTAEFLQGGCGWDSALKAIQRAADLIEGDLLQRLKPKAKQPTSEEFLKVFNENDWNYISPETFEDIARTVLQEWG